MSNRIPADLPAVDHDEEGRERRSYVIGLVLALVLTTGAFAVVWLDLLSGAAALGALGLLALVQAVVHLRFFLHIDLQRSHRDDLLLILFTVLILLIMVSGTIWILYDQHMRMMP
ncbi:cytochrome o ubiquinol oxidase operon protein cyoD [Angulomicrobium tetraedrale]|uniref:Cytochrome bo(3) ubiquinol oxidase subunit 4 n=1 Tax=Ancylobacter tetraedralis TaxID=217068 RepID=A0A839ZDK4_9HYPH|nr:cytochrome o ubiquinol oxidase subunit IV [Ancylobacter tetraedralis]MBB3772735.1 cytochrome o ubiquinol oxidase operon protein cyoD [Ancylobacter tetraedralis]